MNIVAASAIFLLSLLGAYVLFQKLKSTAIITRPGYQAGGALAGFLLVFTTLFFSYDKLENREAKGTIAQLKLEVADLTAQNQKLGEELAKATSQTWKIQGKVVLGEHAPNGNRRTLITFTPCPDDVTRTFSDGSFEIEKSIPPGKESLQELQFELPGYYLDFRPLTEEFADFDPESKTIRLKKEIYLYPVDLEDREALGTLEGDAES